ncbi:hypothetical protein [Ferroacidibacillus organovorans]|uniref:hypothetical protein n=1 Tax=Ferroacidibacillus organovorans TaxID=1765683 RepID=UPI0013655A79|nr:hypothetical protein [Ferroacidibacillus organovorans]
MYMGQVERLYQMDLSLLDLPSAGLLSEALFARLHIMGRTRGVKGSLEWVQGLQ